MTSVQLPERQWRRLSRSIQGGNCILVLGPDAAISNDGNLLDQFAQAISEPRESLKENRSTDPFEIAQRFITEVGDERDLWDETEAFFASYTDLASDFHRDLAHVPFAMYIQTTPDRLMANALREQGLSPVEAYYHLRQGNVHYLDPGSDVSTGVADPTQPLVFSLHGTGSKGDSVLLTETDLLNFLVRIVRDKQSLPSYLLAKMSDLKTTFLFVGFGFHRWYQRMILHVLRGDAVANRRLLRSLALEDAGRLEELTSNHTLSFFDHEHAIDFATGSFPDVAREFKERFGQYSTSQKTSASPEPGNDTPMVFLCYDSRDELVVEALGIALRNRGLRVWRDHDNLRGGDNWDRLARHMITNEADYVLPLHSDNFGHGESYARLEINLALERTPQFPSDWKFIIPCHFLNCDTRLAELEHLQYINVPDPESVQKLVEIILDDWTVNDRYQVKQAKPRE